MIIAIEGPSGSGKSTQGKLLSERLAFAYLDLDAMYRILAFNAFEKGINPKDETALLHLIPAIDFSLSRTVHPSQPKLSNEDNNHQATQSSSVEEAVSIVAKHPLVRRRMIEIQQEITRGKNFVLEGKDAFSVIAPNADIKIFLTRNADERILKKSKGVFSLDTAHLSIEEANVQILKICNQKTHRFNLLYYILRRLGIYIVAPIYFHFKADGTQYIPKKGGFILASNHRSHLDPVMLGFGSPRMLSFMARDNLFKIPGFSRFIQSLNANPIKRGSADLGALRMGLRLLFEGRGLVVFPEGTRSKTGELGPGKPGISMMALRSGVPVIPAWIEGSQLAMPKESKKIKSAPISVRFGPPVNMDDLLAEPLSRQVYDQTLSRIMQAIKSLKPS